MRLLYLYPEEWTARRAREVHTLSMCVALARQGADVTLVTAGGEDYLRRHLDEISGSQKVHGLHLVTVLRSFGPVRSAAIFYPRFGRWFRGQPKFDRGYVIHLKAAGMLERLGVPYIFEAHEIFAETPGKTALEEPEKRALSQALLCVATSEALAGALRTRYQLSRPFLILPNAGDSPLEKSVARPDGPFVYAGSIADWKGLDRVLDAVQGLKVPLRIVGGTEQEWKRLSARRETRGILWQARVPLPRLPELLAGARAGLIPTQPETPSGRYSCPMKLFDYARCGLPVITTALPSLESLDVASWCRRVTVPSRAAWTEALREFQYHPDEAEAALAWAGRHTWTERARQFLAAS